MARLEITSFAFMLDCVPEPVCQTESGKCASSLPSITSCAALTMVSPSLGSRWPSAMLVSAAARLAIPSARTIGSGCFSQPILKWCSERSACAPQYLEASTSMGPNVSVSVRVLVMALIIWGFANAISCGKRRDSQLRPGRRFFGRGGRVLRLLQLRGRRQRGRRQRFQFAVLAQFAELQGELHARIGELRERGKGNGQRRGNLAEGQRHFKMVVLHLQPPELVLKNDHHLIGILLVQKVRNLDTGIIRLEGDAKMVRREQALLLDLAQRIAHDAAQGRIR